MDAEYLISPKCEFTKNSIKITDSLIYNDGLYQGKIQVKFQIKNPAETMEMADSIRITIYDDSSHAYKID